MKSLIADLADANWQKTEPAFELLQYQLPQLAFTPEEAFAEAKTAVARQRLAAILTGNTDRATFERGELAVRLVTDPKDRLPAYTLVLTQAERRVASPETVYGVEHRVKEIRRPSWLRATRAVVILEHIRTPESLELLKEMATGHPDALPTVTAKKAYQNLTAPVP